MIFNFFLSFLKVCFHTRLNKSKNIVFHVNFPPPPPPLPCICLWLISGFNLSLFHRVIRRLSFLSHIQVPLCWITVSVNILQLSFSIYLFLIWTWLSDRQTLVSVYIQRNPALRPPRLYDHLVSPPIAFRPRRENLRVILLSWRPLQCDHLAILRPGFYGPTLFASTVIYQKLARLEGTHLVQSPFCKGRVGLLAGPTILHKHLRDLWKKNTCPVERSICTDQTKATASLVIVLVSRIQISSPGENNFVKWKGAFRSDQPDQFRSVSVKGSHS